VKNGNPVIKEGGGEFLPTKSKFGSRLPPKVGIS
jgi:hypothetical protein